MIRERSVGAAVPDIAPVLCLLETSDNSRPFLTSQEPDLQQPPKNLIYHCIYGVTVVYLSIAIICGFDIFSPQITLLLFL